MKRLSDIQILIKLKKLDDVFPGKVFFDILELDPDNEVHDALVCNRIDSMLKKDYLMYGPNDENGCTCYILQTGALNAIHQYWRENIQQFVTFSMALVAILVSLLK